MFLSLGIFFLAAGFVFRLNDVPQGSWSMLLGALCIVAVVRGWFREIIGESIRGIYAGWEDRSYRIGMMWFIFSEVMFFACFFGALFYVRKIAAPELGSYDTGLTPYTGFTGLWPSSGPVGEKFTPMAAWGVPAVNTLLLLTSGATLTSGHWGPVKGKVWQLNIGLALTVILGLFLVCQAAEYTHAYHEFGLTLGAGVYGTTFFMLTGFHGCTSHWAAEYSGEVDRDAAPGLERRLHEGQSFRTGSGRLVLAFCRHRLAAVRLCLQALN